MINEQYSINEEAIRSLILYLKNLRKEHTTIKKISDYTDISYNTIMKFEKGMVDMPFLDTFMRLMDCWQFSDDQVVEVYKSLLNKDKKLKLVVGDCSSEPKKVKVATKEIEILPSFWRAARKCKKLTLTDVSLATGLSKSAISKIETNEISNNLRTIISLCKFYEVTDRQVLNFYHSVLPESEKENNLDSKTDEEVKESMKDEKSTLDKQYSKSKILIKK